MADEYWAGEAQARNLGFNVCGESLEIHVINRRPLAVAGQVGRDWTISRSGKARHLRRPQPSPAARSVDKDDVVAAPDRSTERAVRDHAMLLFLYNTGVRADEAAHVTIGDITWGSSSFVRVLGKGNKVRYCPLWPQTVEVLKLLVRGRPPNESVFLNRLGNPLTRFGIYGLVRRSVKQASKAMPSLRCKRISPHSVRHTSAVHMLRAGVDINTIRGWLGHVSLDTTHVYAEVDLEMKAKALAQCDVPPRGSAKSWRKDPSILGFLKAL